MSVTVIVIMIIGSFFGGGFVGYQYADAMPDDPYGRCIWIAAKSASGANVRDCTPFVKDMTVAGKIENYKGCRETNKILRPELPRGASKKQISNHLKQVKDYEVNCSTLKSAIKYDKIH